MALDNGGSRPQTRDMRASLRLLGPQRLSRGAERIDLPDRAFAILAYLASQPGHQAKRAALWALLWGDAEPVKANASLRQLLSRTRRALADHDVRLLGFDGESVRLDMRDTDVDLAAFADGDPQRWIEARDPGRLKAWLDLYRGDLMATGTTAGPFDDWLLAQREALRERFLAGAGAALDAGAGLGDEDLLALAHRVRLMEPASDPACRAAMRIHGARGGLRVAGRIFAAYRQALEADYGLEPSNRTRELARSLGCLPPEPARDGGARPATRPQARDTAAPVGLSEGPTGDVARTPARGGPRILILPPITLHQDEAALRLAQAFIEDVTVGLSRYRSFTVIAPHTAQAMTRDGLDGDLVVRSGADFVVHAALKPTRCGMAMTFRLSELVEHGVVSVSEVDWHPDRLNEVFEHLVRKVVTALVDAIEKTTLLLPLASPETSAYRLFLEGRQCLASIDLPHIRRAKKWFRDALSRAPAYAAPIVGLARATIMEWFVVGMPADGSLAEALRLADKGLEFDPLDWRGLREKALGSLWLRRHDDCLALFEEALALGPNDADLIADYADALAHCGDPEQALDLHQRALDLNPLPPDYYHWIKGSILFQTHRYEAALDTMRPIAGNPATARLLAACAARAGRLEEARDYARTLREVYPDFEADSLWRISPNRRREDTAHFIESLRLAGVG